MTTKTNRQFRPIFNATITPATIEPKTSATDKPYLLLANAGFQRDGKEAKTRTVMAFGKSADAVRDLLVPGVPVTLACQFDGGSVKLIGEVRAAA